MRLVIRSVGAGRGRDADEVAAATALQSLAGTDTGALAPGFARLLQRYQRSHSLVRLLVVLLVPSNLPRPLPTTGL